VLLATLTALISGLGAATPAAATPPTRHDLAAARSYADRRRGNVAFAVVDDRGRLRGDHGTRQYRSASVTKAMLLVAYLRRKGNGALTGAERAMLGPMIRRSDNKAASKVYATLGDPALIELARKARMRRFGATGTWSEALICANDQARFFARLPRLVPERHGGYALSLLRHVVPEQRWGASDGARDWTVAIKGGWRRDEVHQVARLQRGHTTIAVAVFTAGNPSQAYGRETIRGVVKRLVAGRRRK
jgi:Beta-lactamase enzyme family